MTNTGMLVQNNTLELMTKGVVQSIAQGIDVSLTSSQVKEGVLFWVLVLILVSFAYWVYRKARRGY